MSILGLIPYKRKNLLCVQEVFLKGVASICAPAYY
jgi:hypothetical protein